MLEKVTSFAEAAAATAAAEEGKKTPSGRSPAMSVNRVTLIGNAGQDPQFARINDTTEVGRFSLATSHAVKNASGAPFADETPEGRPRKHADHPDTRDRASSLGHGSRAWSALAICVSPSHPLPPPASPTLVVAQANTRTRPTGIT